jgi:hypothetical protein
VLPCFKLPTFRRFPPPLPSLIPFKAPKLKEAKENQESSGHCGCDEFDDRQEGLDPTSRSKGVRRARMAEDAKEHVQHV